MNAYELSSQFLGGLVEEATVVAKQRKKSTAKPVVQPKEESVDLFLESIELVEEEVKVTIETTDEEEVEVEIVTPEDEESEDDEDVVEEEEEIVDDGEEIIEEGETFDFEDTMQKISKLISAGDKTAAKDLLDELLGDNEIPTEEEVEVEITTTDDEEVEVEVKAEEEDEEEEVVEESTIESKVAAKRAKLREESKNRVLARRNKLREEAILSNIEIVEESAKPIVSKRAQLLARARKLTK